MCVLYEICRGECVGKEYVGLIMMNDSHESECCYNLMIYFGKLLYRTQERGIIFIPVLTLAAGNDDDGNGSTNLFELNLKTLNDRQTSNTDTNDCTETEIMKKILLNVNWITSDPKCTMTLFLDNLKEMVILIF